MALSFPSIERKTALIAFGVSFPPMRNIGAISLKRWLWRRYVPVVQGRIIHQRTRNILFAAREGLIQLIHVCMYVYNTYGTLSYYIFAIFFLFVRTRAVGSTRLFLFCYTFRPFFPRSFNLEIRNNKQTSLNGKWVPLGC